MRYRPIGADGAIISAISLILRPDPARSRAAEWVGLIYAALEQGINGFDVRGADAAMVQGLGDAFASVDRRLAFVSWRISGEDFSARALADQVREALAGGRLQYLDAVMLRDPPPGQPSDAAMQVLAQLKSAALVRFLGVAGQSETIDAHIESGAFDLLQTPFNLTSGWRERHRLKAAGASNMSVIGYGSFPDGLRGVGDAQTQAKPLRSNPLADVGTYAFLETTPGWKPDEVCLAYALTEPALASVLVSAASPGDVERLAAIVDRDMPPGLAAQIEMARFAPQTIQSPPSIRRRA